MKYIVTLNGKNYEVDVDELNEAIVTNVTDAAPAPAVPAAPTAPQSANTPAPAVSGTGTPVKAPMPGTVLKINAEAGQKVNEGDVIIILEAMKMENEIVAPVSGTLNQLTVQKGAEVATDDILAFIG